MSLLIWCFSISFCGILVIVLSLVLIALMSCSIANSVSVFSSILYSFISLFRSVFSFLTHWVCNGLVFVIWRVRLFGLSG